MNYFFVADEHNYHFSKAGGIIKIMNRPFSSMEEMIEEFVKRHNEVVPNKNSTVFHLGDYSFGKREQTFKLIKRLNGENIFLVGSHDNWCRGCRFHEVIDVVIDKQPITLGHHAMRTWHRSHYGAWNLHGHSHLTLLPLGKQLDVCIDGNGFAPYTWEQIKEIMKTREDNPNLIKR